MGKDFKRCETCGASMMEHRHNFSVAMLEGLERLSGFEGPTNIKILGLTRNQWDNFQKIRYWGLVQKSYDISGKRIGGAWEITDKGRQFLLNEISIPRVVWTYRGEWERDEKKMVFAREIFDGYKTRPEYAEEAVPHL